MQRGAVTGELYQNILKLLQVLLNEHIGHLPVCLGQPVAMKIDYVTCNTLTGQQCRTLAVYAKQDNTFLHYDSASGSRNLHIAKQIAGSLQPYLG